jgi:RNA polymerase sigma-70 factor (ECF subfamily)
LGSHVTDELLIRRWQQGDAAAFDELYNRHATPIYRLGWAMLREVQAAEDVVQETFLRAYRARQRFDPTRAAFGTWLYQIALNHCRSLLRRKQFLALPWTENIAALLNRHIPQPTPETALLQGEYTQALWEAVQKLTPPLQEVIILHYYLELPAVEIAAALDCPEGTVYSRLYHARRRLAAALARQGFQGSEVVEVQNVS